MKKEQRGEGKTDEFNPADTRERNNDHWKVLPEERSNSVKNEEQREDIFIIYLIHSEQSWPCSITQLIL